MSLCQRKVRADALVVERWRRIGWRSIARSTAPFRCAAAWRKIKRSSILNTTPRKPQMRRCVSIDIQALYIGIPIGSGRCIYKTLLAKGISGTTKVFFRSKWLVRRCGTEEKRCYVLFFRPKYLSPTGSFFARIKK